MTGRLVFNDSIYLRDVVGMLTVEVGTIVCMEAGYASSF